MLACWIMYFATHVIYSTNCYIVCVQKWVTVHESFVVIAGRDWEGFSEPCTWLLATNYFQEFFLLVTAQTVVSKMF
jgi:hypothetical protein